MEPFNDVYLLFKFNVPSFSLTGDLDFQTGHFADFEQFKVDIHFAKLKQVQTDPICSLELLWTGQEPHMADMPTLSR